MKMEDLESDRNGNSAEPEFATLIPCASLSRERDKARDERGESTTSMLLMCTNISSSRNEPSVKKELING
jgi:hypothetical protein